MQHDMEPTIKYIYMKDINFYNIFLECFKNYQSNGELLEWNLMRIIYTTWRGCFSNWFRLLLRRAYRLALEDSFSWGSIQWFLFFHIYIRTTSVGNKKKCRLLWNFIPIQFRPIVRSFSLCYCLWERSVAKLILLVDNRLPPKRKSRLCHHRRCYKNIP